MTKKKLVLLIVSIVLLIALITGAVIAVIRISKGVQNTDEALNQIDAVTARFEELKSGDDYEKLDTDEKTEKVMNLLKDLSKDGYIDSDSIYLDEEEHIITYEYSSGILGCELVDGFDEEVDSYPDVLSAKDIGDGFFPYDGDDKHSDALILDAMTDRSYVLSRCEQLAYEWSLTGVDTTIDCTVTLDDLTNLKGYEFVYFKMHGAYLDYRSKLIGPRCISCIFTEQKETYKTNRKYADDLINGRIGISGNSEYFVAPNFFREHYRKGDLANSIFFLGCCQLMGKDNQDIEDWTEAFDELALSAFVAFHNSNYTGYNLDLVESFMEKLLVGENAKSAYDYAISIHGKNDQIWYGPCEEEHIPAYPQFRGDKKALFKWEFNNSDGSEPSGQETTARKNVEVRDAYSEKMEIVGYGNAVCRIPEVIISDTDTSDVNDEIINDHSRTMDFFSENAPKYTPDDWEYEQSNTPLELDYEYYIADDFVSIDSFYNAFSLEDQSKEYYESRIIYNVSIKDGHRLSKIEMLDMLGYTEEEFYEEVRNCIKQNWDGLCEEFYIQDPYADSMYESNLSDETIKGAEPFVNAKGEICIVVRVDIGAGSGYIQLVRPICKYEQKANQTTETPNYASSYDDIYKSFVQSELIPQYGWNSMESFETYLDTSCGEGYAYNPIDSSIEAEGIISADIDDYNSDGVDDMIVVYMYKESAKDMDSVYTKEEHVFSPQTEIYRTRLAAFTIRGNNVIKTDEYDVMRYGYTKKQESIIGCLFPQEQDLKDLYIYKFLNEGSISILFYSRVTSGPMFRFFNQSSWLMGLDSNGRFYLQSSYIYMGSGVEYTCTIYEFTDGVETSCQEYVEEPGNPDSTPYITDYFDEHHITCDYYYSTVIETDNQIRIGGYSTSIDYDENSSSFGYYYFADFFDSGNLSQTMR